MASGQRLARLTLAVALLVAAIACGEQPIALPGTDMGELRIQGSRPRTLDPALAQDVGSWQYMLQIFGGLVALDENLQVVPDAAESYSVSDDGRTYSFRLRDNVRFHDGRPARAEDFRYAIDRALDPATRSPTALQYLGDIVGARDRAAGRTASVAGVRAPDDRTVQIEIDAPKRYFLSKLTYPAAFAVDRANVERGERWFEQPNGTGPFALEGWEADQGLVLRRHDRHHLGRPRLARARYYWGTTPAIFMYERDELDVVEVGLADIERVADPKTQLSRELRVTPMLSIWYLGFNTRRPPFDDVRVRQAFVLATDRQKIADVRFKKTRQRAAGILPPGLPGHDPSLPPVPLDLVRARQLLQESKYRGPTGMPEVNISVGAGGGSLASSLAQMYERNLGVAIAVQEIEGDYLGELERHAAQMFYSGWVADYPDPENFLDILFHSGSRGNYAAYQNPEVDQTLERARIEPDEGRRFELYRQVERAILSEAPVVPLLHDISYTLVKPRVAGLKVTPMGILSLRTVAITGRPPRPRA